MKCTCELLTIISVCLIYYLVYLFWVDNVDDILQYSKTDPLTVTPLIHFNKCRTKQCSGLILVWTKNFGYLQQINKETTVQCDIYSCNVTKDRDRLSKSDIIVFHPKFTKADDLPNIKAGQRWLIQTKESAGHTQNSIQKFFDGNFSYTCTYHRHSDVPCYYGFYVEIHNYTKHNSYFIPNNSISNLDSFLPLNFTTLIEHKNKLALWMYSNCKVKFRREFTKELIENGMKIDIFGRCTQPDPCSRNQNCLRALYRHYKFYLAFENTQRYDYITEKAWKSLLYGMVPIVYGAPLESYQYHLPPNSFLHVENFSSAVELVEYIQHLDKNDDLYLTYHQWRKRYYIIFQPDKLNIGICTLCKSLFEDKLPNVQNKSQWWTSKRQCVT